MALFQAARRHPSKRFERLAHLIARDNWISTSVDTVLRLKGARTAGVDNKSGKDYETPEQRQKLVEDVDEFLHGYYYLPFAMRPVHIPKKHKKGSRTILVPTIRDRVVGHLLKALLEPIFEADFVSFSNGYRPGRGRMDSIADCQHFISAQHQWVLLADIRDCFSSADQEELIRLLQKRIADEKLLEMVRAFLEAGACNRGFEIELTPGAPAGFPLSPLLMNLYLNTVDKWFIRLVQKDQVETPGAVGTRFPKSKMTRYADNLLFVCDTEQDASRIRMLLQEFLATQLGLELSLADICSASEGFTFLGFHVQWATHSRRRGRLFVTIPSERIQLFKRDVSDLLRPGFGSIDTVVDLNKAVSSFGSEFRFVNSGAQYRMLDRWVERKYKERLTLDAGNFLDEPEPVGRKRVIQPERLGEIRREPYRPAHRFPFGRY